MYSSDQSDQTHNNQAAHRKASQTGKLLATERNARDILCATDPRHRIPSPKERKALLVGFAMRGKSLTGAAYDAVRLEREIDLSNPEAIVSNMDAITIIEIKSCSQERVGPDLAGYFFNITSAELLVAQALKDQYRFVFVNTFRGDWQELSITNVLSKAKAMYPAFHLKF